MKPIKRGYKLWCLADQRGFIMKFQVYEGKNEACEKEFKHFGLGERVVLSLTKEQWGKGRIVVFDNFFASIPLLERLKVEGTLACGTIRCDRKGIPLNLMPDSSLQRAQWDYRFSSTDIGFFKWKDSKSVFLVSNYHGTKETTVTRKQLDGSKINVSCPDVVKDYNLYMGGVDLADRYRALYNVDRKSKKWWLRLFWGLLDITFVNSYVIYCQLFEKITVLEYRRMISQGLISMKYLQKRKRSLNQSVSPMEPKKRRKQEYSVSKDIRITNRGIHWPKFIDKRGRCEVCSNKKIQSRPHSKCSHCNIFLCINEKKNCFLEYHEVLLS